MTDRRYGAVAAALLAIGAGCAWAAPVEGVIESVDRDGLTVVLRVGGAQARAVSGTVSATVGRGDARILQPGQAVRGDLVAFGDGYRLQTVWPDNPAARGTIARLGDQLRKDTLARGSKVFRNVGEYLPRFALYDTDGSLFLSESLKGHYVVMNFIFTRCTVATMCPAATERMKELQDLARAEGVDDLRQASVTLDPAYDTPGIFTAYAEDRGIDTATFHFLGGPAGIVEDLKKQMGVLAEAHPDEIVRHTMSTALIDPAGKIIYRIPGSMWSPRAFLDQIRRDKARGGNIDQG